MTSIGRGADSGGRRSESEEAMVEVTEVGAFGGYRRDMVSPCTSKEKDQPNDVWERSFRGWGRGKKK